MSGEKVINVTITEPIFLLFPETWLFYKESSHVTICKDMSRSKTAKYELIVIIPIN